MAAHGVQFPRRSEVFLAGARVADITLDSVQVNSGLSIAALAAVPANLTPVVGQ
jgi:hypothetical protein